MTLSPLQRMALETMMISPLERMASGWSHPQSKIIYHPTTISALRRRKFCLVTVNNSKRYRARATTKGFAYVQPWRGAAKSWQPWAQRR